METITAPAKLTTSLRIVGVRADGFHLIDAEMVSLDLADTIEISSGSCVEVVGAAGGVPLDGDNLVVQALRLADATAHVRIIKQIPPGAGLGGGSSDAGAILRWAGFTDVEAAVAISADVPFCLVGGRARVTGIGEQIDALSYEPATYTLVTPPFGCSTPAVYQAWDELGGPTGDNGNDLESAALAVAPDLAIWRDELAEASGSRPRLAGSGSTWFVEGAHPGPGRVVASTVPAT